MATSPNLLLAPRLSVEKRRFCPSTPWGLGPPEHPQTPGVPQEGTQVTVTEGFHLYWTCWMAPKGDTQCTATGWEGGEARTGIFQGLNA